MAPGGAGLVFAFGLFESSKLKRSNFCGLGSVAGVDTIGDCGCLSPRADADVVVGGLGTADC